MTAEPVKLGEVCKQHHGLIQTGPFGSQLHQSDYVEEGIPVIMPKDILDGGLDLNNIARVSEEKANNLSRHLLPFNSIVIPRRGDINKRAIIKEEGGQILCGTGCIKIVLPETVISPDFFYYFLSQKQTVEWLERNAVGTTMLNLSAKILNDLPIPLDQFPLEKQNKIADILSRYDDAIANNRRRIELLERSARLLYREWFVHLRYPGHEHGAIGPDGIPEGWEKKKLEEVGFLNYGKTLKKDDRKGGNFPVFGSGGIIGTHDSFLVEAPGIIVGRKGSIGNVFWTDKHYYPIDTTYFINKEQSNLFLYHALKNIGFINTDVAVPGLNRDFAHSRELTMPKKQILDLFHEFINPIYQQISKLEAINQKLQAARDLLLPRLMNGEINV